MLIPLTKNILNFILQLENFSKQIVTQQNKYDCRSSTVKSLARAVKSTVLVCQISVNISRDMTHRAPKRKTDDPAR